MRPGERFTDARIRHIKLALMRGADPRAIARIERVSANTIRRIRDGETYNHVVVEGEDSMRRPIDVREYAPPEEGERTRYESGLVMPVALIPDEEIEAMGRRMMERQAANAGLEAPVKAEVEETAEARARRMLGVAG